MSKTIRDRFSIIRQHVAHGDILDVGCVDAWTAKESTTERLARKPNQLFRKIVEANPKTIGVDIDAEGVGVLNGLGFRVICADVETMELNQQFDTIVAGEIIEHVENPGRVLRNLLRHLRPDGALLLSTPNPFYTVQTWKIWRYGCPLNHEDHVNWQDPQTLRQLLERTGFRCEETYWVQPKTDLLRGWRQLFRPYFSHSFMMLARPRREPVTRAA